MSIKKDFNYICKKNIFVIVMIILLCPILGISYSSFVMNTNKYKASEMLIGNLLYSIRINGNSVNTITVPKGETEAVIEITSLNTVSSNYKLVYAINPNINVIYAVDENEPTYGLITNTKTSSVLIMNTSENNITITFDIAGGFITDELANVTADTGYTEVSSNYMKYDYETLAMFVDGVRVEELNSNKYYNLVSYSCTNGETINWIRSSYEIRVKPHMKQTKCKIYFEEGELSPVHSYSCANSYNGVIPYSLTYTGNCTVIDDGNNNWRVKFLTSGTLSFVENIELDLFLVGGGGGVSSSIYCGGGAGGYTATYREVVVNATDGKTNTGGGAGAGSSKYVTKGGSGGGGNGGISSRYATPGYNNTGGGGGGKGAPGSSSTKSIAKNGGSGIVVIRNTR